MGNAHGHHDRKPGNGGNGGGGGLVFGDRQHDLVGREMSPDMVLGPVDITKPPTGEFSPERTGPHRAHRPRATTETGPRRHTTIDYPDQDVISRNNSNSVGPLEGPTAGVVDSSTKQKKMPTIIKYSGHGVNVFVSGKFMIIIICMVDFISYQCWNNCILMSLHF
jgi:hypothetical protein